jgi:KaiC/GvpD/RAD55 family RecA-like ATPase
MNNLPGGWILTISVTKELLYSAQEWRSTSGTPLLSVLIGTYWRLRSSGCSRTRSMLNLFWAGWTICRLASQTAMLWPSIGYCVASGLDLSLQLRWEPASTTTRRSRGLIEKYQELGREGTTEKDRPDLDDLLAANADGVRMRLYPAGVNRACRGGALPGHNITVFARPEAGKTLLAINIAAGFLRDGRRVLYTGNEEPIDDLVRRTLARLSGVPLSRIYESNDALRQAYRKAGDLYDRFYPKQTVSGRLSEVEALVRKYKPDVVIIDQLRNLTSGGESNKTLDLDKIAQGIRDLAKREQIVTVGLTQAGDSADQKLKLGMGDIEWSNTGIPAAADLMIGMGVNDKWDANNRRMINLPKNKIGGQHVSFPVFIDSEKQLIRTRRSTND